MPTRRLWNCRSWQEGVIDLFTGHDGNKEGVMSPIFTVKSAKQLANCVRGPNERFSQDPQLRATKGENFVYVIAGKHRL